jgi:hypothetical protein
MVTLNRFPLLGLWAREAAARLGYSDREADVIGHAYAVLYAIRANSPTRPVKYKDVDAARSAEEALATPSDIDLLEFAGDDLQVSRNGKGELVGRVGDQLPQTAESYRYKVARKFPAGYYERVQSAFRDLLSALDPEKLDTRLLYTLYDQWKKACASERMVDLDRLIHWCEDRKPTATGSKKQ